MSKAGWRQPGAADPVEIPLWIPKRFLARTVLVESTNHFERLFELSNAPGGWDRQGIGRRYFIFPDMSLRDDEAVQLRRELMKRAGRSLVLVPSDWAKEEVVLDITDNLRFKVFGADDIEESKKSFVAEPNAVAVVANRYDGIDFPGDDCRLLFVDGLPRAPNTQERFPVWARTLFLMSVFRHVYSKPSDAARARWKIFLQ